MMLKWLIREESFSIWSINAASFKTLLNHSKKNKIEVFALFMMNINRKIAYNTQCDLNALNVSSINETTQNLKDIKAKLSLKYHEFLNVFNRAQLNKLLSHRFYDHKIELISDSTLSHCQVYWMFSIKLLKIKKYLNENVRIVSRWVNQRKSELNSAWSLKIAITEILRIQKKSKRVPSYIYSRAKQRERSRFAWVSKALE